MTLLTCAPPPLFALQQFTRPPSLTLQSASVPLKISCVAGSMYTPLCRAISRPVITLARSPSGVLVGPVQSPFTHTPVSQVVTVLEVPSLTLHWYWRSSRLQPPLGKVSRHREVVLEQAALALRSLQSLWR